MLADQFYTFFEAEKLVSRFEDVLKGLGLEIQRGSELEQLCLNIIDIVEKHLKPHLRDPKADIRDYFRGFVGMQDLMTKVIKAQENENFHQLIPHLKKLNIANPLQNIRTSVLNQENNKVFELFMATLCLGLNTDQIYVDDPNQSKGDNPDIIARIDGKNWGFGCKALHSQHHQTIFKNIEEAVDQIEKSESEIGIPVLTIKNIVDHDQFWPVINIQEFESGEEPIFGSFLDLNVPASMMNAFVEKMYQELVSHIGIENIRSTFKDKKSQPGCLIYCPTATSLVINQYPVTTRLNIFHLMPFDDVSMECISVMKKLNHQLQLTE